MAHTEKFSIGLGRSPRRVRGEGSTHGWIQTASELRRSYDRLLAGHMLVSPLSLVVFHTESDAHLGEDGRLMASTLRPADCLGAAETGQLVLLLPDTPIVGARRVVQRLGGLLGRAARRWRYGAKLVGAEETSLQAALEVPELLDMPTLRPPELVPGGVHAHVAWDELCDLISWLGRSERSGQILLSDDEGVRGHLELRGGRVVAADAADGRHGREGALAILDVEAARLQLIPARQVELPKSAEAFDANPVELLMEIARRRDEACAQTPELIPQVA